MDNKALDGMYEYTAIIFTHHIFCLCEIIFFFRRWYHIFNKIEKEVGALILYLNWCHFNELWCKFVFFCRLFGSNKMFAVNAIEITLSMLSHHIHEIANFYFDFRLVFAIFHLDQIYTSFRTIELIPWIIRKNMKF